MWDRQDRCCDAATAMSEFHGRQKQLLANATIPPFLEGEPACVSGKSGGFS
jgi:hypothetical protein